MRIYRMSESGNCPKVLAARQLGYEPVPETEASLRIMRESSRHEGWVCEELESEGYAITDRQKELTIETPLLKLVGHIDGIADKDSTRQLLEIKALGRFTYAKYLREGLDAYPEYQAQVTCYAEALKLPILFVVKNRDTGEIIKTRLDKPPMLIDDILSKLNTVELYVRDGELPPEEFDEKRQACRWCHYRYLCTKPEPESEVKVEELPSLLEAAELYKEGKAFEELATERLDQAKSVFLTHSKTTNIDKFKVGGVSVSYLGTRQRQYLDEAKLKELVSGDILKQVYKMGKPWDDLRVRILKEE